MFLNVSNIQHFSVGDGKGIRTTVFFKGCNLRCPWCHNPETISAEAVELYYKNSGKKELCGKKLTPKQVFDDVITDKDFYDESDGGVTFSGGEVMLQADGAAVLAELLNNAGVSLTIDTAGCVPYHTFQKMNPFTDEYLYDFKTASDEEYEKIGGNLCLVSENLERLLYDGKSVRVRIPLIPNFNTDEKSVEKICQKLSSFGITQVDLIPFHPMGISKYDALGLTYKYKGIPSFRGESLEKTKEIYSRFFTVSTEN